MNCGRAANLLSEYLDDQLRPGERAALELHLESCPSCAADLSLLRQTVTLASGLPELELPPGFRAQFSASLAAAAAERRAEAAPDPGRRLPRWTGRSGSWLRRPGWRNALAAVAVLALVFAVGREILPGWDGNVWRLATLGAQVLRGTELPGVTNGRQTALPAPGGEPAVQPTGPGGAARTGPTEDTADAGLALATRVMPQAGVDGSMMVRHANLTVEVRNFGDADRQVIPIVDAAGGYIESSSISLGDQVRSGWYRIRVPQAKFMETIGKLEALGTLKGKELGSEDVSGSVIDLEARISNLRRQELRLGQLLGQAKTLDEVLRVENELSRVRYQIEAAEGQLNWLRHRVAMATIQLNLAEPTEPPVPPVPGADLWRRIWQAFVATWRGIGGFMVGLVVFLASLAPVALVLVALWWGVQRYRRGGGGTGSRQRG